MAIGVSIYNGLKALTWKQSQDFIVKSITTIGIFGQFRFSRSTLIGWKEQKFLVTGFQIGGILSHVKMTGDNLKALGKGGLPKLAVPVLGAIAPALHLLSNFLEEPVKQINAVREQIKILKAARDQRDSKYIYKDEKDRIQIVSSEKNAAIVNGSLKIQSKDVIVTVAVFSIDDEINALQTQEKALEKQHYKKLQAVVDFFYLHLTDIAATANITATVAAIYLGVSVTANSFQLAFLLWGFLEQGLFWTKPCQNQGLLFKIGNGALVRLYDPLLKKLTGITYIPYQFLTQDIFGKVAAIGSLLFIAPQFLLDLIKNVGWKVMPQKGRQAMLSLQEMYRKEIEKLQTKKGGEVIELIDIPSHIENKNLNEIYNAKWTKKTLQSLEFVDLYPNRTLQQLTKEMEEKIEKLTDDIDTQESEQQPKAKWAVILKDLNTYLNGLKSADEKLEMTAVIKTLYGVILEDFTKYNSALLKRRDSLLCDPAKGRETKGAYLELVVMRKQAQALDQATKVDDITPLRAEVEGALLIAMQEIRDRIFQNIAATTLMEISEKYQQVIDKGDRLTKEAKKKLSIKEIAKSEFWIDLRKYLLGVVLQAFGNWYVDALNILMTNTHGFSLQATLWGKNLGLSTGKSAKADIEELCKGNPVQRKQAETLMAPLASMFESLFNKQYFSTYGGPESFEDELIEIIADPFDERIRWSVVQNYLYNRLDALEQDVFEKELLAIGPLPNVRDTKYGGTKEGKIKTIKGETAYQQDMLDWKNKCAKLVEKYLPILLHDTGIKVKV